MANAAQEKGVSLEVLGTCWTNTIEGSQHDAKVEYRHLWSYAQQAALIAVSEKSNVDGCYHLITDPERRAKRIAGHYAELYFKSAEKSDKEVLFYWPALAAFVVKDIVEAYRFVREEVLHRDWNSLAGAARNSTPAAIGSKVMTNASPYQHALRTYSALAKGNLWLFMDIYPWLWFFLEYGVNSDGTLNKKRLGACLPERNWSTFQKASKEAVEELPYGPKWMGRLSARLANDQVFKKAGENFSKPPAWSDDGGYGHFSATVDYAHRYCRAHVRENDNGYRTPLSGYWGKFKEAYYVMESEHAEAGRMANDQAAMDTVVRLRSFSHTDAISQTYALLISEVSAKSSEKSKFQAKELIAIAEQEQVNVLQPLIYNDPLLKQTMDVNHRFSRLTNGWLSPKFKVIYSASAQNADPELETVFDVPDKILTRLFGERKSLPVQQDRMQFVETIARDFNRLMLRRRPYMDRELKKIANWVTA